MKLLLPSKQFKKIRRQYPCHRSQVCIENAFTFFSHIKIFKQQLISQILELRTTFVRRFENMTFDNYLTKPKSMLEWKLFSMLDINCGIVCLFDYDNRRCKHPFMIFL